MMADEQPARKPDPAALNMRAGSYQGEWDD